MNVEHFYSREAADYDRLRWEGPVGGCVKARYEEIVRDMMPSDIGGECLEIGCGTGRFTVPAAERGVKITAIDVSEQMLAKTRANLQAAGCSKNVTLALADARATQFAGEQFSLVFSFNVVNHVPHYERVVAEVARILKPGGVFVVGFPSLWSLYLPYASIVNLTQRSIRRGVFTRWPSTPALVRQARGLGLRLERSAGMFHWPPTALRPIAPAVAAALEAGNRIVAQRGFEALASTRVLLFRKGA